MIIEVTTYNTKVPMFINTDKIIKFYKSKAESACTYIEYENGQACSMLTIEEDPKWLQQKINVKDAWF